MAKWIGPGYPFTKGLLGYPNVKTDEQLIKDSIFQILNTRKGERFFNREFGSDLHKLVFEPNDEILKDLIDIEIKEAISRWENRVEVLGTSAVIDNNQITVEVQYKIKQTGQIDSLQFSINR